MPGPKGIITVKGSFELSDLCDKEFHKMAQNFGMMANYGEPKDKTKSSTTGTVQQLEAHPAEPEVKKTVGTAIRTRQAYRRRRENLGGIGDKVRQKQNRKIRLQKPRAVPGQCPLDPEHRSLAGSLGSPCVSYITSINKDKFPLIRVYVSLNKKLRQTHQNKTL
jgi:hypothetical protein